MNLVADRAAWLRLAATEGIGVRTAHTLLARFGSPDGVFGAGAAALAEVVSAPLVQRLCRPPDAALQATIDDALAWARPSGHTLLTLHDTGYPPALREIADPPILLYVVGRPELLLRPALALVGSRNASRQGLLDAEAFACDLSAAGLTIVSGLALGIDGAAHRGALPNFASTVAVLGCGVDRVYPLRHRALALALAERGALVSELPLGTPPERANFPRRNRIISGLALGVLVIEAARDSGSLISAQCALDQNRQVFAIPGSIHAPLSKGCHALIRDGATLVECSADVLQDLAMLTPLVRACRAEHDPEPVLALLGSQVLSPDALAASAGLDPAELASRLLLLELDGRIERLPGGTVRRLHLYDGKVS